MKDKKKPESLNEANGQVTEHDKDNKIYLDIVNIDEKNDIISEITDSFPVDVFPDALQSYINEIYGRKSIPKEFMAGSFLSAFSTAAGKKFKLRHNNYDNYAGTWIALVGLSGTGKSEPIKIAYKPIKDVDNERFMEYEEKEKEYNEYQNLSKKDKKTFEGQKDKPYANINVFEDATLERLFVAMAQNINGICNIHDELMSWVNDLERYGNRSVQSKWLSIWSNASLTYMRKDKDLNIPDPFVNLIGGLQKDLIQDFSKEKRSKDGTLHRLNYCMPDTIRQAMPSNTPISEQAEKEYENAVLRLLKHKTEFWEDSGKMKPYLFKIEDGAAAELFRDKYKYLVDRLNSLPENEERKFISKLQIYLYRYSLLLHLIKYAYSQPENMFEDKPASPPEYITYDSVLGAVKLIGYFHKQALKVAEIVEKNSIQSVSEKSVLIWLRQKTEREYNEILKFAKSDVKAATFRQWINRLLHS